jgi:hypothetical protein
MRFGDPRVRALAGALFVTLLAVTGITKGSLRALMTGLLGTPYSMAWASYDLARLSHEAIRKFMDQEMVGDHVTMEVREVIDHYGDIIVRVRWHGSYDKTGLPDEFVVTTYFAIRDGKITSLAIIANQPSPY